MNILCICDDKNGHKSQLSGVAHEIISQSNTIINTLEVPKSLLNAFNSLAKMSFTVSSFAKNYINKLYLQEKPTTIIAIGRRTLSTALYAKRIAKENGLQAKIFYLMPPGFINIQNIDYIFYHSYKRKLIGAKFISINTAPHNISPKILEKMNNSTISQSISQAKAPLSAVIIGGDAKNIKFSPQAATELALNLKQLYQKIGGTLIISTSQRTKVEAELYLKNLLKDTPNIFWGYNTNSPKENPYLFMLKYSQNIIVTGESISIISEAIATPKEKKVYIYFEGSFFSQRYVGFHHMLYKNNYAEPFQNLLKGESITRVSINNTPYIANFILKHSL